MLETHWPTIPFGAEGGIYTEADSLPRVVESIDGTNLNEIWNKLAQALTVWNQSRSALSTLLGFWHTNASDAIPQAHRLAEFEEATEHGEPEAIRTPNFLRLGYELNWYDAATRYSWQALMAMSEEQILAGANYVMESDENKINREILQRLFNPEPTVNENETPVYGLWSADGQMPPSYLGKQFAANHTHYLVSGNAEIDSGDIETLAKAVAEHGYNADPASQLLLLVNSEHVDKIASFRAGQVSDNTIVANNDFVPSEGTPAFYSTNIEGKRAPEKVQGLKIAGSYGSSWIVPINDVPEDYLVCVATYGPDSPNNCVGIRQHPVATYQGLRHIPGPVPGYPLQESFYSRGFGVGIRRRGQAAVMQIKESGEYETPDILFA